MVSFDHTHVVSSEAKGCNWVCKLLEVKPFPPRSFLLYMIYCTKISLASVLKKSLILCICTYVILYAWLVQVPPKQGFIDFQAKKEVTGFYLLKTDRA